MVRTTAKVLIAVSLVTTQTACAGLMGEPFNVGKSEHGVVWLGADGPGLHALGDVLLGATEAKNTSENPYWGKRNGDNAVKLKGFQFKAAGGKTWEK